MQQPIESSFDRFQRAVLKIVKLDLNEIEYTKLLPLIQTFESRIFNSKLNQALGWSDFVDECILNDHLLPNLHIYAALENPYLYDDDDDDDDDHNQILFDQFYKTKFNNWLARKGTISNKSVIKQGLDSYDERECEYKVYLNEHGRFHRLDGPAEILTFNDGKEETFYYDGLLHNENGPADVKFGNFYLGGVKISAEDFKDKNLSRSLMIKNGGKCQFKY